MGVVDITSITQVIEWGNLASIVAVDTRITDRSKEPTLGSGFADFAGYAYANANVSAYYDTDSEVRQTFELIAAGAYNKYWNPEYTMVGEENTKLVSISIRFFHNDSMFRSSILPTLIATSFYRSWMCLKSQRRQINLGKSLQRGP